MTTETREAIEMAYNHIKSQSEAEDLEMTDAGKLMYSLLVATLELDDKLNAMEDGMKAAITAPQPEKIKLPKMDFEYKLETK